MSKAKKSTHSSEELSSSSCSSSSMSSDEEVDARDLKPIKDYVSNRRELARQLFRSVKIEKIRMMLPQALKKIDLNELEEWCASELNGLSKKRIFYILNGETMLESSDTCESDDSGPSLEIISDTEEWFTDDDVCKKDDALMAEGVKVKDEKSKLKGKSQSHKRTDVDKLKAKTKPIGQKEKCESKTKNVTVKTEEKKETGKEKEGDSLLDLLELEMRARAIRALIRKEEDVIPNSKSSKNPECNDTPNESNVSKSTKDEQKDKDNCRRQLEEIISAQHVCVGDDEDVVLVTQPTTTIELLSSDSEGEGHSGIRVNKKLENERVVDAEKDLDDTTNGNIKSTEDPSITASLEDGKSTQETKEACKNSDTSKHKTKRINGNNDKNVSNVQTLSESIVDSNTGKRRKVKKKSHLKQHAKPINSEEAPLNITMNNDNGNTKEASSNENIPTNDINDDLKDHEPSANKSDDSSDSQGTNNNVLNGKQCNVKQNDVNKMPLDEEKCADLEEIIDLDDYCDDMEDMENFGNDKNRLKQKNETDQTKSVKKPSSNEKGSSETWASRYFQTDDVQSVIRESKIQSEIRKRLRERQRQFKLNKSPNSDSPSPSSSTDVASKDADQKPKGSVDEYFALKRNAADNVSINNVGIPQNQSESGNTSTDINSGIIQSQTETNCPKGNDIVKETKPIADNNVNMQTSLTSNDAKSVNVINEINPD